MKVTDLMVEAAREHFRASAVECGVRECPRCLRAALEAALADVPEPLALLDQLGWDLARAEAKLEKVRAWLETFPHNNKTLRAILDEAP